MQRFLRFVGLLCASGRMEQARRRANSMPIGDSTVRSEVAVKVDVILMSCCVLGLYWAGVLVSAGLVVGVVENCVIDARTG